MLIVYFAIVILTCYIGDGFPIYTLFIDLLYDLIHTRLGMLLCGLDNHGWIGYEFMDCRFSACLEPCLVDHYLLLACLLFLVLSF